jgi:transketolase
MFDQRDEKAVNALRFLSVDAIEKAKSGHPGLPLGAAALSWVIWKNHLRINHLDPTWTGRDRFILSAGHGSMLLYSLLHLFGFDITLDDIKNFRQWGSKTPGHPEYDIQLGIETTTGPLGQGFATGVGMAMAAKHLGARYRHEDFSPFDNYVFSICGDGDLEEGVSSEAASLAGHLGLGNMIYIYDNNRITIDGPTSLSFSEDVAKRFESYNWQILRADGYNLQEIDEAINKAKAEKNRPTLIIADTHIGYGSPNKQDTASVHGSPLGEEEIKLTKKNLGWPEEPAFYVPEEIYNFMNEVLQSKEEEYRQWQMRYEKSPADFRESVSSLLRRELTPDIIDAFPVFGADDKFATRAVSGQVINAVSPLFPSLWGGSADLAPSNNTLVKGEADFEKDNYAGKNLHFGIREHAMGSIANGIALYGGLIPYVGTFLVFSDYLRPAIRLAAMMKQRVIYIFTHDSIGLGEDGPTHQPVEHFAALRSIPNLTVIRPADANETAEAWKTALQNDGPTALLLTRQGLPTITTPQKATSLSKGGYIVWEPEQEPRIAVLATGSEVSIAVEAAKKAEKAGISCRVVSMPSWERFEAQPREYQKEVLPENIRKRIAVEAGIGFGWERFGIDREHSVFMKSFGASAKGSVLFEKFGFSAENILKQIKTIA